MNVKQSVETIRKELPDNPELNELCTFIETSERGIIR
jgi:acyl-[acyl carrier protein]--UDP-N-acetylglucosamine O-acyltransferase